MIDPEENDSLFMEKYGKLLGDLKSLVHEACPEAEMLVRYFEKDLGGRERRSIEMHLDWCPVCLDALQNLKKAERTRGSAEALPENWNEIETEISQRVNSALRLTRSTPHASAAQMPKRQELPFTFGFGWRKSFPQLLRVPQFAYAGVATSLALAVLYAYAYFSRPAYFALAQIEPETSGTVRGEDIASQTLREGLSYFEQGKYQDAIRKLEQHLSARPRHYAANYHLGLAYLMEAKVHMLGLPYDFDSQKIMKGVGHLQQALEEAGENAFYQEDCLWYLGKAYLMLGDWQKAKEYFAQLANLSRPNLLRKDAARKMVVRLERAFGHS